MSEQHWHTHYYGESHLDRRIQALEEQMATLADEITRLQADDAELAADVTAINGVLAADADSIAALQAQVAAGGMTPDQQTALEQIATDLEASHATLAAAIPAPAAPAAPPADTTPAP